MKSTPTISLISGQNVPYNISYFPSTLPSATVHGDESSPVTSLGLETIKLDSRNSNFDRGTQTSFKYVPQKKKSQEEKINQLSSKSRHEQEGTAGAQTDFQAEENARKSAPLNRSASYEKAILSSMKDIDYNINIDNKSPDYCKSNLTGNSKTSSELSPGSPSSNKSSSRGLVNVSEAFTNRRGTFEKWKRRASGKKTSSSDAEEDKGMELLKYEQFEYYNLNDEERNLNRNTDEGSEVKGEESGCLKKRKTSSDSSTLVIGTKQKSDVQNELSEARKDRAPIVIGVKEKPSKEGEKELEKESKAGEPPLTDSGTRTTSRAKEMLQKAYTCYPEGGGGGSEYPYLREMKERLLIQKDTPLDAMEDPARIDAENQLLEVHQTPVGTVVKLNADGYGSHTSPTHRVESFYTGTLESRKTNAFEFFPKNAKTSSFITLSLLYATLLVVVCLGFVLSEVLTHNVPLYYYEAFFTYLYGISIFFLLYVFCYLLSGSTREPKPPKNQKVRKPEVLPTDGSPTQEKLTTPAPKPKKQKTTDNDHSHGSFFLRIGAIAFGLGTMIYNGLEFGVFFEIPMSSPCYQILRGVNPLLQLVFTFMQMYFIFMNARLNIHKFKFLARFGLMHIVATNICVWVRTLVRESLKEINEFRVSQGHTGEDYMIMEGIRRALENRGLLAPNRYMYNLDAFPDYQDSNESNETISKANGTSETPNEKWSSEEDLVNRTCERMEIMGSIVSDSAPYLYPFIVEYSLIGAAVVYIMWKHIGRNPKFVYDPEAADGMSVVSRRCHSKVDCVGASKGLFCGLLVLVATLICLILFFVLIHREELRMLAIYLADVSHCGIMFISIIGIFIGFCRVRHLKFFGEREEELDDILLMVSAFGLFAYAIFSAVAGSLSAFTEEPNLLVMVTGILSVIQVMIQIVFVKDTQRRQVALPEQERTKPGRQIVTFLLICNLAMWVIYTFETQKVEANPVQLEFFGKLSWTILLRCTVPLAIFHRFYSSVVLAAIWKNSYKTRLE